MEKWKTVIEFPEYSISSHGRLKRIVSARGAVVGNVLKQKWHSYGYPIYTISSKNKTYTRTAHSLVAVAFIGPRPTKNHQVSHIDGNPKNCKLDNLKWATAKENAADKFIHGTQPIGSKHQNSKLKESDVLKIRKLRKKGMTFNSLSKIFGVSASNICEAFHGNQWSHVK